MNLTLRRGKSEDTGICGAVCYEAFKTISQAHDFPHDIPSPDIAAAFRNRSLSLYTKLGFEVREPLACMQGAALGLQNDPAGAFLPSIT